MARDRTDGVQQLDTKRLSISVPHSLYQELEAQAARNNVSLAWVVRKALSEYLDRDIPCSVLETRFVGLRRNTLHEGDCLKLLSKIDSSSVDMVLCDLPYGTTQNKWDSLIPLDELWAHYERIVKPKGVIVLSSQGLFTARLMLSKESWFKYKFVWIKVNRQTFECAQAALASA